QESNTFVAAQTTLDDFRQDVLLTGKGMRERFAAAHHEVGGFFTGLEAAGIEAVPLLAARALPSGPLTAATFDELMARLEACWDRARPLDGLLVAPHGATVGEHLADVDGHWLQLVRRWLGRERPIVGTLDPHANLTPAMVEACDALVAYRTNPHVDQRQRGLEAADLMARTLGGEIWPVQAAAFPPLAINIECQSPDAPPCRPIYELAEEVRLRRGVLSASVCLGFPYADVPQMGAATIAVTDGDNALAGELADELARCAWSRREQFVPELIGVDAALDQLEQPGATTSARRPVCLLDMGDNVGGGGPGDGTWLAAAIHRRRLRGAFVCLYDPQAVAQAVRVAPGQTVRLAVGGKTDALHGLPIEGEFTLRGVFDGAFAETAPRHGGVSAFNQGMTAIVETVDGMTVMLTSKRAPPWSLQQLRSCGLDPASFRILVAKGVHSPLAAYREACDQFIRVNTPGATTADLHALPYRRRRRPMFPFESHAPWDAADGTAFTPAEVK
ncbi:MAG: hypothetical protein DCC67_19650, partial [Planctomycetota bacterium]